jgi:hypothetical protein
MTSRLHFEKPLSPGLEVVVNHEGGFAATIVSLFSNQKLSFRTEVPDQVRIIIIFEFLSG